MKHYAIRGGNAFKGTVSVSGSKNACLPIMAASLLTDEDVLLYNVPMLRDSATMIELLRRLGKRVQQEEGRVIIRSSKRIEDIKRPIPKELYQATYSIVKQMRASIVVLGPLIARYHKAHVSLPGGCSFGPRPVDLHIKGMEALGATITLKHGYIDASVKEREGLRGTHIRLLGPYGPTVLGTDNVAMAAALAHGTTYIEGAAQEPETHDLLHFLSKLGVPISGIGTSSLCIQGVERLGGGDYQIIDDRIEAATFLVYAAITGSEVFLKYRHYKHITAVIDVLREIGVQISIKDEGLHVKGQLPSRYKAFEVKTGTYPHFPTDMQSILMVLGCLIPGKSILTENVYPNRFNHVGELQRMGAKIKMHNATAMIEGVSCLESADIQASDLRSGAALMGAALAAKGTSFIRRVYHIERGYEDLVTKLKQLDIDICVKYDTII